MKKLLSTFALCTALTAGAASAATMVSGVIEEGPNVVLPSGPFYDNPTVLGDFSNSTSSPDLYFTDDAWIFGRVYDDYKDGFTIKADDYKFKLQISALGYHNVNQNTTPVSFGVKVNDDGTVIYNNALSYGDTSVLNFSDLTGEIKVQLSAFSTPGTRNGDNVRWLVDIVDVQPVPLPASSLLLLGGLGGLAAMRRRKKA